LRTAMAMQIQVFWEVMPRELVNRSFGKASCLHIRRKTT